MRQFWSAEKIHCFRSAFPKGKKKEEKEKFALWLYNCPATLSAVYVLSFQVYRAALFLHGSSGTGALMQALRIEVSTVTSGKHSAKKVKESRSLLHFFFSLLPSFLRYARNKSRIFAIWIFARFNSLLSRLLSLFFFFFYSFGNVWNVVLYTMIFDIVGLLEVMLIFNW